MDKRFNLRLDTKMLNFIKKYKTKHQLNDNSDSLREIIRKEEKIEKVNFFQKINLLFKK